MGILQDALVRATSFRFKPLLNPTKQDVPLRATQDGTLMVANATPGKHVLADEGSYFVTTNPTPGTAIAYGSAGTQASFSDSTPFMQIINTASPTDLNAPVVWLDYIKILQNGTAPASTTSVRYAIKLDNGYRAPSASNGVSNVPQAASGLVTSNVAPVGRVITYAGAVATIPIASNAARLVAVGTLKGAATVNLDEYTIVFGGTGESTASVYSATVSSYCTRAAPIGIAAGQFELGERSLIEQRGDLAAGFVFGADIG